MLHSDLVNLFNTLTVKELKRFSAYLSSPSADQGRYRSEVQVLFKILQSFVASGDEALLEKDLVYKKVFPEKEYIQGHIERVMFELSQQIRTFLIQERYLDPVNLIEQQLDYIKILVEKGIMNKASLLLNQTINDMERTAFKSSEDYSRLFDAYTQSYSIASQSNKWKTDLNIRKTLHYLDLYYWSQRLQRINHYLLISKVSKLAEDTESIKLDMEDFPSSISLEEEPAIFIAFKIYQLLIDERPQKEGFEALRQLLTKYESQMDRETSALYFSYLRNYCVHLYMYGHHDLVLELHQIQKDNLAKGYLHYSGKIPVTSYSSIAATALRAHQYDWAYQFIEEYKNMLLDASNAQEMYFLNLADYYFHTGQYDKALEIIPGNSNDLNNHLRARRLEIKSYYEAGSDLLIYKIEAFKVYVHRASKKIISERTREYQSNFVNLLLQLTQTLPSDKPKLKRILDRIEEKQQISEKEWLLEKVNQLLKKK